MSAYYTQEEIDAMGDDAELDALNQLWSNFCITYTYEPGSTVKPFTVACGLDTGTFGPRIVLLSVMDTRRFPVMTFTV